MQTCYPTLHKKMFGTVVAVGVEHRVPYFSGPDLTYNGTVLGNNDPDHTANCDVGFRANVVSDFAFMTVLNWFVGRMVLSKSYQRNVAEGQEAWKLDDAFRVACDVKFNKYHADFHVVSRHHSVQ